METAGLVVTIGSMLIAAWSAWIAFRQRRDAQQAAASAATDARESRESAQRVAAAQERIAAGFEVDRQRADDSQAKKIRIHGSQGAGGRGRIKVSNASNEPIFDVHIHSITAVVDGVETVVQWQPNPYMSRAIKVIDRIDGGCDRELFPFFGEDWTRHQWAPIVRFLDAHKVEWEINLASDVTRVDD
ncbi:hypothetical protein [Gordonia sp. CPCC 205333]|uniref:hypothetical protein n=1 Tax=Gordonia sp. CPCC 205333 TaxID=3140790 RepID=UPI003AF3A23C